MSIDPQRLRLCPTVVVTEPNRTPLVLTIIEPLEVGRDCAGLNLIDAAISRRHLLLEPIDGALFVTDLTSLNGSAVSGETLVGRQRLCPADQVDFGRCSVRMIGDPEAERGLRNSERDIANDVRATSIGQVAAAVLDRQSNPARLDDAGTVTIVFTDIEGSTKRAVELGDVQWHQLLSVHNQIIRTMLSRHAGSETHSLGDGFMMCFRSARAALGFITDVQRALAAYEAANPLAGLRVRAGVHTGEAVMGDDGDLIGRHVVMASRIADSARGGEIIVSSLVREIVEPHGEFIFGESRSTTLKGLQGLHLLHRILP